MPEAKLVSLDELKEWKNNPRKNETNIEKLAHLLAVHGQRSPVIADVKSKVIYKGNATYKAICLLRDGGIENFLTKEEMDRVKKDALIQAFHKNIKAGKVWCSFQAFSSEEAAIAYGISDNRASEYSEWDQDLLNKLMENEPQEMKISTGFSEKEIDFFKQKFEKEVNISNRDAKSPRYKIIIEAENAEEFEKFEVFFGKESDNFILKLSGKEALKCIK